MARALILFVLFVFAFSPVYAKGPIGLTVSISKILRLPEPVKEVVIGNPYVFGAILSDTRTVVMTGYAVGSTNMILIGRNGKILADTIVVVEPYERDTLFVHRGISRSSYSCTPKCTIAANVGDTQAAFNRSIAQYRAKISLSKEMAK